MHRAGEYIEARRMRPQAARKLPPTFDPDDPEPVDTSWD